MAVDTQADPVDEASVRVEIDLTLAEHERLLPYVPILTAEWDLDAPGRRWRRVEGTLCFVDISGFTQLSEKLARRGRIGAEELTDVLDRVFGEMLRLAYARRGALLKFGGDAMLLIFGGDDHQAQAVSAAVEMRAALRAASRMPTSVGRIPLRMSVGLHTGQIDLFKVGAGHKELVITGECATTTTEMEAAADAGEILVSDAVKRALPLAAPTRKGPGWLLRWRVPRAPAPGPVARREVDPAWIGDAIPTTLRRHLRHGLAESEHRIATVGFLEYKGIGAALGDRGPEWVADALHQMMSEIQAAADEEDVTFLATDIDRDGGKVILVAGVPASHEDDEGRVLRVVRRVVDADLAFPLHAGVNRGHVFAGEVGTDFRSTYTVMGDTVNLAARLMAAAPAGSVYASPAVLDRSHTLFETTPLEPFHVKGKAAPVQAYTVGRETGTRPAERTRELPFTGRSVELEILRSSVTSLGGSGGRAFTVTGDTGVGKTRLVQEALAGHDGPVVTIRAEPNSSHNPYWAFRDPLRHWLEIRRTSQAEMGAALTSIVSQVDPALIDVLPLIGDVTHIDIAETEHTAAIEPRFRPDRTADALIRLLESRATGSLVVVAEDCHWMDDASLALVRRLAGAAETRPWLLVVTARPASGRFDDVIGESIALDALSPDGSRELAIAATAAAPLRPHEYDIVVARSGGNPLFLQEILRLVRETGSVEALPESLDAVAGAEIDALPPLTRKFLRYSSVLGRSYRKVVLDLFLAPEGIGLDPATRRSLARFIEEDGPERWRFRHAVMHQVAYEGLSYSRRRELHARAGAVIERLAGEDTDAVAEFLATHYALAADHEKAWRYSKIAAEKARAAYANVEASRHYEAALRAGRRLTVANEDLVEVGWRLAQSYEEAGLFGDAAKAYRMVRQLTRSGVEEAEVMLRLGRLANLESRFVGALRWFGKGLELLGEDDAGAAMRARAGLAVEYAATRGNQGRWPDVARWAQRGLAEAEAAEAHSVLAQAHMILALAHSTLGTPGSHAHASRALEIFQELGELHGQALAHLNIGIFAHFEGRWADAVEHYDASRAIWTRTGNPVGAAMAGANIGEIRTDQGSVREAETTLRDVLRVFQASGQPANAAFVVGQLGRIAAADGRFDEARRLFGQARSTLTDLGVHSEALTIDLRRAEALLLEGLADEASEIAAGALGRTQTVQADAFVVPALLRVRARALMSVDRDADALALLERSLEIARERDLHLHVALALDGLIELNMRGGRTPSGDMVSEWESIRDRLGLAPAGIGLDDPHPSRVDLM